MNQTEKSLNQLLQKIEQHFNLNELRRLIYELDVDWEELVGDNKSGKIISLIDYFERRERLGALITVLRRARPSIEWPDNYKIISSQDAASQIKPSLQSRNSISANNRGKIIIGGDVIQESEDNSLEVDSDSVVEAKRLIQRYKKK